MVICIKTHSFPSNRTRRQILEIIWSKVYDSKGSPVTLTQFCEALVSVKKTARRTRLRHFKETSKWKKKNAVDLAIVRTTGGNPEEIQKYLNTTRNGRIIGNWNILLIEYGMWLGQGCTSKFINNWCL